MQDSYKPDFQMQFCYNDFRSNTRILREFPYHMSFLQGLNSNTIHLQGFWVNHKDITGIVDSIYSFGNSPYLKKILDLKHNFNINIVAQIQGEYKVYKPPYILISDFFSLRGHICLEILSSLLVMPEPYLWWVHQTGTVYVCQSASCELWLWLVRLDWYSDSTRCHLLIQMLRPQDLTRLAGIRNSRISDRPNLI